MKVNNEVFWEILPPGFLSRAEIASRRKVWIQSALQDRKLQTERCTVERLVQIRGLPDRQNCGIGEGEKGPLVPLQELSAPGGVMHQNSFGRPLAPGGYRRKIRSRHPRRPLSQPPCFVENQSYSAPLGPTTKRA